MQESPLGVWSGAKKELEFWLRSLLTYLWLYLVMYKCAQAPPQLPPADEVKEPKERGRVEG